MLRVKNGPWAPLRLSSMPSWPATGTTCMLVMTGAFAVSCGFIFQSLKSRIQAWSGAGLPSATAGAGFGVLRAANTMMAAMIEVAAKPYSPP
ncbi:hypothetical protein D3C79_988380 [compost metagenome]